MVFFFAKRAVHTVVNSHEEVVNQGSQKPIGGGEVALVEQRTAAWSSSYSAKNKTKKPKKMGRKEGFFPA